MTCLSTYIVCNSSEQNHHLSLDPCCTHTRKEHSLGVMKLSGKLVKMIMKNQKKLDVTKMDVLCVMLAGLCHDLGHGEIKIQVYAIYIYLLSHATSN